MDKTMEYLRVSTTTEGAVEIQTADYDNGGDVISVSKDQIDVLIHWLQEAKEELEVDEPKEGI